jgi:hypothetical protein
MDVAMLLLSLSLACGEGDDLVPAPGPPGPDVVSQTVVTIPAPEPTYGQPTPWGGDGGVMCTTGPDTDILFLIDLTGPNEDNGLLPDAGLGEQPSDESTAPYLPYVLTSIEEWLQQFPPDGGTYRFGVGLMALADGGDDGLGLQFTTAGAALAYLQSLEANPASEFAYEPMGSLDAIQDACTGELGNTWRADAGRDILVFTHDDGETLKGYDATSVVAACADLQPFTTDPPDGGYGYLPYEDLFIFTDSDLGYDLGGVEGGYKYQEQTLSLIKSSEIMLLELNFVLPCTESQGGV